MYTVMFLPDDITLTVNDDETILDAGLRERLDLPYNCQMASCGTCKSLLVEGRVTYGDTELYAIDNEEIKDGYVLLCAAKPLSDCVIQLYPDIA
ncbi:MAG: hypothetical protein COV52_04710 [Gammaproteobacteria bacterium CG11_big_fil_rev_8_21_14_0_20_46_22]|nr:MAG: hypothetical protein COW05_02040 [Gammaproteobacteria bacterium CG12_big_fil_rev_8_21_14_0_65_46_12]PIR11282.1 MAG: hypothetical protein COV52_04710 [Gammaproteobacteria bacterium CG11_big_fil_rev_8_21_14_0_20_46_22]